MTWIKKQIRIILITIFGLATCYGAGTLDLTTDATLRLEKINTIPLTQQIGNKEMSFKWNDGMDGEDIIIVSDEKDYFNMGGFSSTFSATNVSKEIQQVNFTFDIPQGWEIKKLEKFKNNEEKTIKGETIAIPDSATSTGQTIVIPDKIIQEAVWENMNTVSLASEETRYFRVSFKSPSNGQFIIRASTDKGAIGKLDPWTYEQLFNTLNDGDLNGQDSWANWGGGSGFSVQTTTKYEGAKGVTSGAGFIAGTFTAVSEGTLYIAVRASTAPFSGEGLHVIFRTDANTKSVFRLTLSQSGNANGAVDYGAYSANQWYVFGVWFDTATDKWKSKFHNGTSWTAWSAETNWEQAGTTIDTILFYDGTVSGTQFCYFDTITPTDPVVAPPAEIPYGDLILFE